MEAFFIYLLKSSGIMALFWCIFKLLLEKETFFELHRIFFLGGIFMALFFPLWTLTKIVLIEPLPIVLMEKAPIKSTPITNYDQDWWLVATSIYAFGVFLLFGRLALQLLSLKRLIKHGNTFKIDDYTIIETKEDTSPFSFLKVIVYNPAQHQAEELKTIIAHEKIHSLQWHSLDILSIHILSALQWPNPFAWFYKKSLSQNLEYIADQGAAKIMDRPKEYQYLLVKNIASSLKHSSIINPFYTSTIKKRIFMLNKNRSNKYKAWKFSLVIPFLTYFLVAFNTKTATQVNTLNNVHESLLENVYTDTTKVEFTIDKTSTEKDLLKIINTLKKDYNVELIFTDISRNAAGLITAIQSSFWDDHGSGSSNTSHKDGIKPFSFILELDSKGTIISKGYNMRTKELADTEEKVNEQDNNNDTTTASKVYGPINPIYIVDGIEVTVASEATGMDPANIHSVNVLKGAAATNKYGEKAKAGVIEIITKPHHNTQEADKPTAKIPKYSYIKSEKEPLFVIDGVEKDSDFDFGTIPPGSIETMKVLKGQEANNKYGEKATNGVVEITIKTSDWNVDSGKNSNDPNTNSNWNALPTGSIENIDVKANPPANNWKVGYKINMFHPDDIYDLSPFRKPGMEKAVIFVDGVNMGKNYVPTMKHSEVESTGTYGPSPETTKKYGKQGKNGVIEISTKKN